MGIGFNDEAGIMAILFSMGFHLSLCLSPPLDDQRLFQVGVGLHVQNPEYIGTHVMNVVYGGRSGIPHIT